MKVVKFVESYFGKCLYNPGDVAGFSEEVAEDLIKRKIAEEVKADKKAEGK